MKRRHGINTSRATRIKSDSVQQNNQISEEPITSNGDANIDIPSFEETLQPVPTDSDKTVDLFDNANNPENHLNTPYLITHQNYANTSQQHQNSILNAYYNMTTLQTINPTNEVVDMMNSNMYR